MFNPSTPNMYKTLDPRLESLLSGGQQFHPATPGSENGASGTDAQNLMVNNMFQRVLASQMQNDGGQGDKTKQAIGNMTPLLLDALAKYKAQKAGAASGGAPVPTAGGSPMPGYGGDNEQTEAPTGQQPMPGYGQQPDPQLAAIMAQLGKGGMLS